MRQSLLDQFVAMNVPEEGQESFMYTDSENLVTTAIGFLLPNAQSALQLQPYWTVSGQPATDQQVLDSYAAVAAGGINSSVNAYKIPGNIVRLTPAGIQYATQLRINEDEPYLREGFPNYDSWNTYGQAGLWSMAWAMGPAFWKGFPQFTAAMNADPPHFGEAADKSAADAGGEGLGDFKGSGIAPRLALDNKLWTWAQQVQDNGWDPDQFDWQNGPSVVARAFPYIFPIVALATGAALTYPEKMMRIFERVKSWLG